jgi:hypothetical protein
MEPVPFSPRTINYVQGVIPTAVYGAYRTINTLASVSHCRICVLSYKNMAHVLSDALCFVVCTSEYVTMSATQYVAARLTKAAAYLQT